MRGIYKVFLTCGSTAVVIAAGAALFGWFEPLTRAFYGAAPAGRVVAEWWQGVGIVLAGFGLAWSSTAIARRSLKLVVMAIALAETALLAWVLHRYGLVWPPFVTLCAGLLGGGLAFAYGWTPGGRRAAAIARFFGDRISPEAAERLRRASTPLPLEGERREVTVLTCEWLDREALKGRLSPGEEIAFREAWKAVGGEVLKAGSGLLIYEDPERLTAVFGAIEGLEATPPLAAAGAALALRERLEEVGEPWGMAPHFGTGLASGEATVGVCAGRLECVGPVHAAAHRLALANAGRESKILLDSATKEATGPLLEVVSRGMLAGEGEERELFEPVVLHIPAPEIAPEPAEPAPAEETTIS
ncbi:MAG TPA: hypothetical protein VNQ90_18440 [Chthoniobacteraceae bacterium]|nr:hypothetical protein [Chthoniobacteraceae bacterium]